MSVPVTREPRIYGNGNLVINYLQHIKTKPKLDNFNTKQKRIKL